MIDEKNVLKVENLRKYFKIYPSERERIKEWMTLGRRISHKKFLALDNISFQVRRGEFLGIIGPNGAGKSTLLKIITGVLDPTEGTYTTNGKVLSLIELSGGMEDQITGRENIIRSAQLLGFPSDYIRERMVQIEEFADLGGFFDRPLYMYSSGMRIRLAFSLFAFLESDVLILDEVLAVGDIFFKQKCYARLEQLIERKTAIVLVTHSTSLVRQYCDRVIVLNQGEIIYNGEPVEAIKKYFRLLQGNKKISISSIDAEKEDEFLPEDVFMEAPAYDEETPIFGWPTNANFNNQPLKKAARTKLAELTRLAVCNKKGKSSQVFEEGEDVYFYFEYQIFKNMGVPIVVIDLLTQRNLLVHSKNSLQYGLKPIAKIYKKDILRYKQKIKLDISPNRYIVGVHLFTLNYDDFSNIEFMSMQEFNEKRIPIVRVMQACMIEVLPRDSVGGRLSRGICNLSGELQYQILHSSK